MSYALLSGVVHQMRSGRRPQSSYKLTLAEFEPIYDEELKKAGLA